MATHVFRIITMAGAIAAFEIVGWKGSGLRLTAGLMSVPAPPQGPANGQPGPNTPAGKAPEQGFVPDAWPRHEGSLL